MRRNVRFGIPTGKARIEQYDFRFASNSRYLRVEEYTPQRAASPFYDVDERKIRRWLAGDTRILESIAMLLRGNDPAPLDQKCDATEGKLVGHPFRMYRVARNFLVSSAHLSHIAAVGDRTTKGICWAGPARI